MAYPWAEMAFCSHCGKLAEGGRFCTACGGPIAPDAVEAMTAELHRHRKQMRLIVVALCLVLVTAGLIVVRSDTFRVTAVGLQGRMTERITGVVKRETDRRKVKLLSWKVE